MRSLGSVPDPVLAERFCRFLASQHIAAQSEREGEGACVWVLREDDLELARQHWSEFLLAPQNSRFDAVTAPTKSVRPNPIIRVRERWSTPKLEQSPVVIGLAGLAIVVAAFTRIGDANPELLDRLMFASRSGLVTQGPLFEVQLPSHFLDSVRAGEVWRLFSPILIHYGLLHLVFNLMWLRDLGTLIESIHGSLWLLAFVLVAAALSNCLQAWVVGPNFGGLSGVNYALFGYLWGRSRFDPSWPWQMSEHIVISMWVWFAICWLPGMASANYAHLGGVVVGVVAGALVPHGERWLRRLQSEK